MGDRHSILVVDDHDLLRLGLRALVQANALPGAGETPVYEARSLQAALDLYREHGDTIGTVLLDLELPDARGLSGVQAFLAVHPDARVVVLSGSTDPTIMRKALAAGAVHYLAKSADLQHVIAWLRSAGADASQSPPASRDAAAANGAGAADGDVLTVWTAAGTPLQLTPRQVEVLEGVRAGRSNRQIAQMTCLTEGTIKNHVSTLLLMFGVRSRAELIAQLR